nr:gluconate 2-dehydrogenase subunit 3 family protein [Novosphingobium profundi]
MKLLPRSKHLGEARVATLARLVQRVTPQPEGRAPANTLALVIAKIDADAGDGFRPAGLPRVRAAWQCALDAINAEAREGHGAAFADISDAQADVLLKALSEGQLHGAAWGNLDARTFWSWRLIPDLVSAHWAHPSLWSAMGFGGPASPRGYLRQQAGYRDPWEAEWEHA